MNPSKSIIELAAGPMTIPVDQIPEFASAARSIGMETSFEEIHAREAKKLLASEELDQLNQKLDGLIKQSIPHRFPDKNAAREFIKNGSDHGQNIVIVDEAHFKSAREFDSIVPRQNSSKVMYVSENGEYSDYAIPKIISNLSTIQQTKQNIIRMDRNRNNNYSSRSMLERQLEDMTCPRGDIEIRQHVNTREEREKTRNALYSRVKQTPESNRLLDSQPDSSPILVQQTQNGKGKTEIVNQFWKKASFDATVSELIQQSSRLVIGANEFIYDRATFVNQSKVRSALGLIKDIDKFIAKLTGILNSSPVDDQPLPNLSEFPQYAAMAEIRRDLVDAFCSRVAPMYGKPRERANRLISEMPLNYQIELTEKINSHL